MINNKSPFLHLVGLTLIYLSKSIFDTPNHAPFPKEAHLPDRASRDNQVKKKGRSCRKFCFELGSVAAELGVLHYLLTAFHKTAEGYVHISLHWQVLTCNKQKTHFINKQIL